MSPGRQVTSQNAWKACRNNTHPIWWKDAGLRKSIGAIFMYMTAQALGGYDKSLINNLQAIPTWGDTIGNPTGGKLGILTAMLSIGVIAGSPIFGYLSDRIGRRYTMWLAAVFMQGPSLKLIGAVLQAAANGYELFIGGRFIIGFGAAGTLCSGPLLTSEIAHPRQRGVVTAFYNTMWYVGSVICAWLSFGTSFMEGSDWAWRIPCIGQGIPPVIILAVTYWLPESPRYLIKKGKDREAKEILARYHANGNMDDELVNFEIAEIKQALELEEQYESRGIFRPWLDLVATKPNRYRMFIIAFLVIGIDWCGTSITSYYLSSILRSVGITSANQQTGINGGLQIFNWLTAILGASLVEKVGRRPLWLITFGGMLAVNIPFGACSALYATRGNVAAGRAVIALVFLYQGAYNIGCNPLPYLYTVEILPYSIRAKGLSFEVAWDGLHAVLGQYTNPMALEALEWRFYFVYTAFLIVFIIGVYFTFPETKGFTLEDIAAIFGDEQVDSLEIVQKVEQVQDRDLINKGEEEADPAQLNKA